MSRADTADKPASAAFIEANLGLVHSIANRFRSRGIEYEELFSAGCVGLMKAAKNFDDSRGLCFSTYAVPVIMGEIRRLFRDGGSVKVSRGLRELSLKAIRARNELSREGGEPRISDIARAIGVSEAEAAEALSAALPPVSLTSDENDGEADIPTEAPEKRITERLALKKLLSELGETDRRLIYLRYWKNLTQAETGALLGMTQVQVSRREKKLLLCMRVELTD